MILEFSDTHLGIKTHSSQLASGYVTTEAICIDIFNQILEAASRPEITCVVCGGDLTHNNHPTTLIIEAITSWAIKLNELNKPIYFIPGNHDKSYFSHSFSFLKKLNLKNFTIYDSVIPDILNPDPIKFNKTNMYFIPFVFGTDDINKYNVTQSWFKAAVEKASASKEKSIIFSHFQESSAVVGSESAMISKSVETFDVGEIEVDASNILCVLGHIHKHQEYTKKNGMRVTYVGSTHPMDKSDCNQSKGYILINPETLETTFVPLKQSRNFIKYVIPEDITILNFIKSIRLSKGSYIFIEKHIKVDSDRESDKDLLDYLKPFNITCASINYIRQDIAHLITQSQGVSMVNVDSVIKQFTELSNTSIKSEYDESQYQEYLNDTYDLINNVFSTKGLL